MVEGLDLSLVSLCTILMAFWHLASATLSRRVLGNRGLGVKFANSRNIMLQTSTRPARLECFNLVDSFKDLQKNKFYDKDRIAKAKKIKDLCLNSFKKISSSKPVKCFCLSDLHADSERNQIWVKENCRRVPENSDNFTVIILPGDVGSECDRISRGFEVLTKEYDLVCFIPGNHELWRRGSAIQEADNRMAVDSIAKMQEVLNLATKHGVCTSPVEIQHSTGSVLVMPLHAWYHSSWDQEPEITHPLFLDVEKAIPFHRKWGDYSLCTWPSCLIEQGTFISNPIDNTVLAEAFAALNEPYLYPPVELNSATDDCSNIFGCPQSSDAQTVLSFSHYLPRQELVPEKRFLSEPLLSKVIGSDVLEAQVRRLQPDVHLFGHTHIPMDRELDGIRYLQWPLGYYREAEKQCAAIYNSGPLLVYDSSLGQGKEGIPKDIASKDTIWSRYYESNPRRPEIVDELAPWVISRLETFSGFVYTNKKREEQQQARTLSSGMEESKGSIEEGSSFGKVRLVDGK